MGVMSCSRRACENIMCDRYSGAFGYICDECYAELCSLGIIDIGTFMETVRGPRAVPEAVAAYYDKIFPTDPETS